MSQYRPKQLSYCHVSHNCLGYVSKPRDNCRTGVVKAPPGGNGPNWRRSVIATMELNSLFSDDSISYLDHRQTSRLSDVKLFGRVSNNLGAEI